MVRIVIEGDPQGTHLWAEEQGEDVVLGVQKGVEGRRAERWVDVCLVTTSLERLREVLDEIAGPRG